jgi:hypothetical protein
VVFTQREREIERQREREKGREARKLSLKSDHVIATVT